MFQEHDHYAFPHEPIIETVMRFGSVKRWHMVDTIRIQTLAEHSANVALLTYAIASTAPETYFGSPAEAAMIGLLHDLPEVFTGDMPSPTKKYLKGLKETEVHLLPALFHRDTRPEVTAMVKMCDIAEGIRFLQMHGPPGRITNHALMGLHERIVDLASGLEKIWPAHVIEHVRSATQFYFGESGNGVTALHKAANVGKVDPDVARGQGDSAGSPGPKLCNDPTWP